MTGYDPAKNHSPVLSLAERDRRYALLRKMMETLDLAALVVFGLRGKERFIPNPDFGPERASNWEIGANLRHDGLFTEDDVAMVKLGYFNWNIDNYIARAFRVLSGNCYTWYGMQVYNINRASPDWSFPRVMRTAASPPSSARTTI